MSVFVHYRLIAIGSTVLQAFGDNSQIGFHMQSWVFLIEINLSMLRNDPGSEVASERRSKIIVNTLMNGGQREGRMIACIR